MTLTIAYDNFPYSPLVRVGCGFSCVVSLAGTTVLFDTGAHAPTLIYNLQQLRIDPPSVDAIVVSHIDSDHVGGLYGLLECAPGARVFVPASFPAAYREAIARRCGSLLEVTKPLTVAPGVRTTAEMGRWIKEIALVVESASGVTAVIGDAHPGLLEVIERAKMVAGADIDTIVGGFHTEELPVEDIKPLAARLKQLGVKRMAPVHSSGIEARRIFQEEFGPGYIEAGVGRVIEVE